jgi:magnesium-transporting ATPase (P-type)
MQRPPRSPKEPLLSGFLFWRVVFVSMLFVAGAFGVFFYALDEGHPLEIARTMVVNAVVVMEIFYLFSIRYVHGPSITWRGVFGTPAVLIGVALVVAMQFAFTYVPVMQKIFGTAPIGLVDGFLIVGVGVALLLLVEIEKRIVNLIFARRVEV